MGSVLAWLERCGVYAWANIRGGGEYGEGWHADGSRANKQHCFDDLHAAARALIDARWTDVAHVGIVGRSAGGLLMEVCPNGEYGTHELGTVTNAAEFAWLNAYSPLQHVRPGTDYPAVLLITAENDPRVAPWQSRKFAAAKGMASILRSVSAWATRAPSLAFSRKSSALRQRLRQPRCPTKPRSEG